MHAYLDLRVSHSLPQVSLYWQLRTLQGMADATGHSNFFRTFFHGFFELNVFRIDEFDAPQLSGVVELRFLGGPSLLFLFVELLIFLTTFLALDAA